jgi:hypothetical protein
VLNRKRRNTTKAIRNYLFNNLSQGRIMSIFCAIEIAFEYGAYAGYDYTGKQYQKRKAGAWVF